MTEQCNNCKYYNVVHHGDKQCRRHPPDKFGWYSCTQENGWCGEYRAEKIQGQLSQPSTRFVDPSVELSITLARLERLKGYRKDTCKDCVSFAPNIIQQEEDGHCFVRPAVYNPKAVMLDDGCACFVRRENKQSK